MDIATVAAGVTSALVPALPFLVKAGEKGAEVLGQQLGAGVWETARRCGASSVRRSRPIRGRRWRFRMRSPSRGCGYPSRAAGTA